MYETQVEKSKMFQFNAAIYVRMVWDIHCVYDS